jgi:hypothetical protein
LQVLTINVKGGSKRRVAESHNILRKFGKQISSSGIPQKNRQYLITASVSPPRITVAQPEDHLQHLSVSIDRLPFRNPAVSSRGSGKGTVRPPTSIPAQKIT